MAANYDQACYDLAASFLFDHPNKDTAENRDILAAHIQTEIENWIEFILKPFLDPSTLPSCQRPEGER